MSEPKVDAFFINILNFVAAKTQAEDDGIRAMMFHLKAIANQLERGLDIVVAGRDAKLAARGLAGVTSFIHDRILPEAMADENDTAIDQLQKASKLALQLSGLILNKVGDGEEPPKIISFSVSELNE
ncbi:MAG: hypothetical protein OQJ97_00150 [Rhodospirillales bacterium]|nr:hypothetical protein [Rhodospirillales bacterium]